MADVILIDTDVVIDYLRGQPDAIAYLEGLAEPPQLSAMTVAELYAGVREGQERADLESFLTAYEVVLVDEAIAMQGGLYRREFGKSHSVGIADAVIAATATAMHARLVTLNRKHFPMLTDITVPYRKS